MQNTDKLFSDLNGSRYDQLFASSGASAPQKWINFDITSFFKWHQEFGNQTIVFQANIFGGYAFYPTQRDPVASKPWNQLFRRLYEFSRAAGGQIRSYFCVGADLSKSNCRKQSIKSRRKKFFPSGFLTPESPWTVILFIRIREILRQFAFYLLQLDWLIFDNLKPDYLLQYAKLTCRPSWRLSEDRCGYP